MSQFTIYRTRSGPLACRLQTDLGTPTPYLLCAPVVAAADWGPPVPRLHVDTQVHGARHLILMTQLIALPASELTEPVGDASAVQDDLKRAVDLLVSGF